MEYRALQRTGRDAFAEELNKAAAEGYRVISAGASFNTDICGLEWWAIVGRGTEAAEEPKDETAGLLEAARKIKEYCDKTVCKYCPFRTYDDDCEFSANSPNLWGLDRRADE